MQEAFIQDKTFDRIDCSQNPLTKGEYENCIFNHCNFADHDLSEFKFIDCAFNGCNLSLVKLNKTALQDANILLTLKATKIRKHLMKYASKTPEAYLNALEPDWRKDKLEEVRALIKNFGPELKEGIAYNMLSYGDENKNIFHLNAQKGYVSLYVGNIDKVENSRALLKDFDMGKGCIRIKQRVNLSDTRINEFIERTIRIWRQGGNTDC